VAGRTITVTEMDGRRIARLRVAALTPPPAAGPPAAGPPAAGPAAAPAGAPVSAGQVRLDSEAPQTGDPVTKSLKSP
jgi:hypothetical protein